MILIVSAVFPPEPVVSANISSDLALELLKKWRVKVITPTPTRPMGYSFKDSNENKKFEQIVVKSYTCPESKLPGRIRESYSFGKHSARFIKANKINIQCIYVNAWPLLAQYLIVKAAKKSSIPVVLHVQDIYPESLLGKLRFFKKNVFRLLLPIDKYVIRNATRVVTISPAMKLYLCKTRAIDDQKVDIVYNWQNEKALSNVTQLLKPGQKKDYSNFTFMYLGSLSRTAAIQVLISAFAISEIADSRLVIAGNGSEKDYLAALANEYKGLNIEFWDAPMAMVPEIQEKADVLLLSLAKGAARFALPSKLAAYMLSQKPIIACVEELSDTANVILKSKCGWVVPPEDPVALAKAMNNAKILSCEELIAYGKNGHSYAHTIFSQKNNLNRLVNIIEETILPL